LEKVKSSYLVWHGYHVILPRIHRNSFGDRVDKLFIELIESVSGAIFTQREEKLPFIRLALRKLGAIQILLMVMWETKSLNNKRYELLSFLLDEAGRMLSGWSGQVVKQNSSK